MQGRNVINEEIKWQRRWKQNVNRCHDVGYFPLKMSLLKNYHLFAGLWAWGNGRAV